MYINNKVLKAYSLSNCDHSTHPYNITYSYIKEIPGGEGREGSTITQFTETTTQASTPTKKKHTHTHKDMVKLNKLQGSELS
jgi:hypothetical protein